MNPTPVFPKSWHVWILATLGALGLSGLSAWAATNTWIVLNPTPSMLWEPASFTDCSTKKLLANPPGRSFSGSAIGEGRIYYFGGLHFSYPGNDMVIYDIAANQWLPDPQQPQCVHPVCPGALGGPGPNNYDNYPSMCTPAGVSWNVSCLTGSCFISSGGVDKSAFRCAGGSRDGLLCAVDADCSAGSPLFPGTTGTGTCSVGIPNAVATPGATPVPCPTCRPYSEHVYQRIAYNPVRHKEMLVLFSGTWEYDYATRSFTWLTLPPPRSGDLSNRMLLWDSVRQRMLFFQTGSFTAGVYAFNYATNAWTLLDSYLPTGTNWVEPWGSWNGQINKFVIALKPGTYRWYTYDPALTGPSAWTEITAGAPADVTAAECGGTSILPCFTTGLTYDEANQRTIVLTQDVGRVLVLWAYDAVNNTWQKITTSGASNASGSGTGYANNLLYDATSASLYLIDSQNMWVWGPGGYVRTLKITLDLGSLPPPDATPPSQPQNLQATAVSSSQITLAWSASTDPAVPGQTTTGVQGYRIYRCQGAGCTPSAQPALSPATSYQDGGLQASTVYTYAVSAYDAAGNASAPSASASATTPGPGQPANPPPNTAPPGAAGDLSSVRVYPNPWRADQHRGYPITFDQFTGNITLKIFAVSGHLMKTLSSSTGSITWDLTNESGKSAASGMYLYLLTNDQGEKARGKLVIIR